MAVQSKLTDRRLVRLADLLALVVNESREQVCKWGVQVRTPFEWMCYLHEESGELAQAVNENYYNGASPAAVVREAIQVATLALKIAEMYMPQEEEEHQPKVPDVFANVMRAAAEHFLAEREDKSEAVANNLRVVRADELMDAYKNLVQEGGPHEEARVTDIVTDLMHWMADQERPALPVHGPGQPEPLEWWAYRHINGAMQVKRYFGMQDLDEAATSPFVKDILQPFKARNREEAAAHAKAYFFGTPKQTEDH